MSKWLAHFLQKTCQTSTDKTDTTLQMREVSVMSVSDLGAFEKNNLILDDVSVMSVLDLGTFEKNNVTSGYIKNQQAIDLSPYVIYYNERFDASDVVTSQIDAEWRAMNDTLAKYMEDTNIPIQSKEIAKFLGEIYEATGFNLRI